MLGVVIVSSVAFGVRLYSTIPNDPAPYALRGDLTEWSRVVVEHADQKAFVLTVDDGVLYAGSSAEDRRNAPDNDFRFFYSGILWNVTDPDPRLILIDDVLSGIDVTSTITMKFRIQLHPIFDRYRFSSGAVLSISVLYDTDMFDNREAGIQTYTGIESVHMPPSIRASHPMTYTFTNHHSLLKCVSTVNTDPECASRHIYEDIDPIPFSAFDVWTEWLDVQLTVTNQALTVEIFLKDGIVNRTVGWSADSIYAQGIIIRSGQSSFRLTNVTVDIDVDATFPTAAPTRQPTTQPTAQPSPEPTPRPSPSIQPTVMPSTTTSINSTTVPEQPPEMPISEQESGQHTFFALSLVCTFVAAGTVLLATLRIRRLRRATQKAPIQQMTPVSGESSQPCPIPSVLDDISSEDEKSEDEIIPLGRSPGYEQIPVRPLSAYGETSLYRKVPKND